jgi:hypothetical protein
LARDRREQPLRKNTCVGNRKELAVAVEVFGVSAFFTVVSLSSAPLSEVSTPTPESKTNES